MGMLYRFEFRPYQRKFANPLITSHGIWDIREGIILRLQDDMGRFGWGEIAPISWFGSETLEQALNFCQQVPREISTEEIYSIPDTLPACQFGFESALEGRSEEEKESLSFCGLLASGEAAFTAWELLWNQGYRTFKWKIGVNAIVDELTIFHKLRQNLPVSAKLRLDANGGLSEEQAKLWLENCDANHINEHPGSSATIEFIEQPLGVDRLQLMLKLSRHYQTAIALDESVATLKQLRDCYKKGWRGIFVIKPGIAGFTSTLRQFCQKNPIDVVFSSVIETAIGRQAALQLARELTIKSRAVGFGISHWFIEDENTWLKQLWQNF